MLSCGKCFDCIKHVLFFGPTSASGANAECDLASLRRRLGELASSKDVLHPLSSKTVPMELFVEEITDCLKEVHMELVKQRLSELKAAGDAMSRHIGGARGKDWLDGITVGSERAFEPRFPLPTWGLWMTPKFSKQLQVLSDAEEVSYSETDVEDNMMFEVTVHKATVTKYTSLML